jgi:two-component system probable response regulator PhcQ
MNSAILLVDDDDNLRAGLVRALRQQPYQIFTARSADEAMWCLKTHPVQVVVSDDHMPGMSGIEFLAWVARTLPDTARIILTGNATTSTAIKAINDARVLRFFTKPCDVVELALVIRQALEERQRQEQAPFQQTPAVG